MKIKLDENLPTALAERLGGLGHDVETVFDEALSGEDDDHIWQAAPHRARQLRIRFAEHPRLERLLRRPDREQAQDQRKR